MQKYLDVVLVAKKPEEFAECIKKALKENKTEKILARQKKVENASWDNKARLIFEELSSISVSS